MSKKITDAEIAESILDQRRKVDAAYAAWQWEENRDRGYDFQLCERLRHDYYRELDKAEKLNKAIEENINA